MRKISALSLLVFFGSPLALMADNIPYGTPGVTAPTVPLTATVTGRITGYFYGSNAGGTDYVRLLDATSGYTSLFVLPNHSSTPGQSVDFGAVSAGDVLVFELVNSDVETTDGYTNFTNLGPIDPNARTNQYLLTSNPADSVDGFNHAYVTSFSGDASLGIPAGVFLSMEDLPLAKSDLDYNDTQFVFTDVSATAVTPEPGSFVLLGTGLLGTVGAARRRFAKVV